MAERFGVDLLLLEKLAAGGMAEVFRARQLGVGGFEKTIAVKRILSNYAANEEFKEMFRQEANLSAQLGHPNIAQVFTNGEFENYLFLVMEFVDGKNVRQLLARADRKKVRIPIEISCFIVCEAAKGLEYAHHFADEKTGEPLEIVHRDMSPQNIMLSYDGAVKVVDFGIAKAAARADTTRAGVLKGKFGYMAPEQASGMKLDKRTDVFALGIILFELLTQRRLFSSDDDLKTLQLVKDCRVPRPSKYNPSVSSALDRIVLKALSKERNERYGTAGELYADLLRFLNQKYPKFIPTDFSNFLKQTFEEDIRDEKKRREKINAEIPAVLATPQKRNVERAPAPTEAPPSQEPAASGNPDTTNINEGAVTELSATRGDEELPAARGRDLMLDEVGKDSLSLTGGAPAAPLHLAENPRTLRSLEVENIVPVYINPTPLAIPPPRSSGRLFLYGLAAIVIGAAYMLSSEKTDKTSGEQVVLVEGEVPDSRVPATESGLSPDPVPTAESPSQNQATETQPTDTLDFSSKPSTQIETESRGPSAVPRASSKGTPGFLNLDSVPRATEIYINGQLARNEKGEALSTPVKRFSLKPGKHEIRLKNSSFGVSWQGHVNVDSDRISAKDVVLK